MSENTIFVFIPDTLEKSNVGFLSGYVINKENQSEFYITRDKLNIDPTNCIGYCGMSTNFSKLNWIHLNNYEGTLKVSEISCGDSNQNYNLIFIIYDYSTFRKSEIIHLNSRNYGEHFNNLARSLKYDVEKKTITRLTFLKKLITFLINRLLLLLLFFTNICLNVLNIFTYFLKYSSTLSLTHATFSNIKWVLENILKEQKISLNVGNIVTSKMIDILLGVLIAFTVFIFKIDLYSNFNKATNELITHLQELLKFLMGSPVGLKLNHAFNTALGNFFLYHIELWKTFLIVVSPLLNKLFNITFVLSMLGFSFQTALAADVFTLATFHVYCIYVYAARLYGVQIRGLLSLWKLFIGRKHNPLRKRVDSCQYSHHQLFVGTLAFTILLFLLPTTMLYYLVFTTLKLVLSVANEVLKIMRHVFLTFPLYATVLWCINSSKVKGTVYIQITDQKRNSGALTLCATLKTESWWQCITGMKPQQNKEFSKNDRKSFSTLLNIIVFGDLL